MKGSGRRSALLHVAVVRDEVSDMSADRSQLVVEPEPRVRRARVARYGVDVGCEAAADAMVWAVEHGVPAS